jgi:hypothetical protein
VPRGFGSVGADGVVGDDYKLCSFDVVPILTEKEKREAQGKRDAHRPDQT